MELQCTWLFPAGSFSYVSAQSGNRTNIPSTTEFEQATSESKEDGEVMATQGGFIWATTWTDS